MVLGATAAARARPHRDPRRGAREPGTTACRAADVVLAVEVVSPGSEVRDRGRRPRLYAMAAIPLLAGGERRRPTVYVHELDPAVPACVPAGIHRDRLRLAVPFGIDIDLTEIGDL